MTKTNNTQKSTRLSLGKNSCVECDKKFLIEEQELVMPGTKDLESVYCPHCGSYNGDVFVNGIASLKKIEE